MIESILVGLVIISCFTLAGLASVAIYNIPMVKKWWEKVGANE